MSNSKGKIIFAGGLIGIVAALLVKLGNPVNMGVCVACFLRDIAGGLGLHRAETVQYIRPEILGFILGAFLISKFTGEFRVRGGSNPLIRFFLGFFLMLGALVFLGCPLRAVLRLANGDLNALVGIIGYAFGIFVGAQFIKNGFSLGRSVDQAKVSGYIMPLTSVVLLIFLVIAPAFIFFSQEGPGSMKAPLMISLAAGLILGVVLQRTRLCTAGGIRDAFLIKDFHFLWGLIGIFVFALIGNLVLNPESFKIGFTEQPIAHTEHIWNFLGMALAGICSALLGGCPLRQTILSGEGDIDAAITVLGLIVGAAFAHNFGIAASPKGVPSNGKVAVIVGLITVVVISIAVIKGVKSERGKQLRKGENV